MNELEQSQLRSQTYRFFAGLLNQAISQSQWPELVAWAKQIDGDSGFLAAVRQWILNNALLDNAEIQQLAIDFTRLFSGIAEQYGPPPPYEHLYREGAEQSSCKTAVIQCYNNSNLVPLDPYHNSSDHIVSELQYMALLAAKQPKQEVGYLALHDAVIAPQINFLNRHLLTWVTQWQYLMVNQNSQLAFYPKIIEALVCFLQQDLNFLSSHKSNSRCISSNHLYK